MDEDRRIRFLIPPMLFAASLFVGAMLDQEARKFVAGVLDKSEWSKAIGLIASGGALVIAVGYIIGTITYSILRFAFLCCGRFHEVALSAKSLKQVWDWMDAPGDPDPRQELSAGAAFDHSVLKKNHEGVHEWLFRRWNGFNTAANSITALALSFLAGPLVKVPLQWTWFLLLLTFAVALVFVAWVSWHDTMKMAGFMASLKKSPAPATSSNDDS